MLVLPTRAILSGEGPLNPAPVAEYEPMLNSALCPDLRSKQLTEAVPAVPHRLAGRPSMPRSRQQVGSTVVLAITGSRHTSSSREDARTSGELLNLADRDFVLVAKLGAMHLSRTNTIRFFSELTHAKGIVKLDAPDVLQHAACGRTVRYLVRSDTPQVPSAMAIARAYLMPRWTRSCVTPCACPRCRNADPSNRRV